MAKTTSPSINPGESLAIPQGQGLGTYFTRESDVPRQDSDANIIGHWYPMKMNSSTNQYKVQLKWRELGMVHDAQGFCRMGQNGRYLIACTLTFGLAGDAVDVYMSNGTVLKCVIADIKSQNDANANMWGHDNGKCIVEMWGVFNNHASHSYYSGYYSGPGIQQGPDIDLGLRGYTVTKIVRGNNILTDSSALEGTNLTATSNATTYTSVAQTILDKAKSLINKPYNKGSGGPDKFDNAGFVYYCYKEGGKSDIVRYATAAEFYKGYEKRDGVSKPTSAGIADLLFFASEKAKDEGNTNGITKIAISDGDGGYIIADESVGKVEHVTKSTSETGKPSYILRILSDSEYNGSSEDTSSSDTGIGYEAYAQLSIIDPYSIAYEQNLETIHDLWEEEGYKASYLIDMDHGGEFKFYVPEFTEKAGSNWNDIDIAGRSVSVKAYKNTNSRSITISLDLYAGVGFYDKGEGEINGLIAVSKLHDDANFLKSLEYPDYGQAIVRPPATVQLVLNPLIKMLGVVSDVSVEHMKPVDRWNRSMYLKVSFTVTQTAVNPPDYSDIRDGRYTLTSQGNVSAVETVTEESVITSGDTEESTDTTAEEVVLGDVNNLDHNTALDIWKYLVTGVATGRFPVAARLAITAELQSVDQGEDISTTVANIINNLKESEISSVIQIVNSIYSDYNLTKKDS